MAEVRFSPAARLAYDGLEKAAALQMLDAIDDAVDLFEADPSSAHSVSALLEPPRKVDELRQWDPHGADRGSVHTPVGQRAWYTSRPRDVYTMRMARVNISVPDEILSRAKAAGLNVSQLAAAALAGELDRRAKIAELDRYLRELDAELGPVPAADERAARQWADAALGTAGASAPRRASRSA